MEFANLVETVAKKLGVTIEKVYPILQQRMMYDMHMDIFWIIFSLIIIGLCGFFSYKAYQRNKGDAFWEDDDVVITIICVVIAIVNLVVVICCASEVVYIFQSPDYYMLQLLKSIIR